MATPIEIAGLLAMAGEAYDRPVTEGLTKVWVMVLGKFYRETLLAALKCHMETSPYFPKPADLTKHFLMTEEQFLADAEANCLTNWERNNLTGVEQATRRKLARTTATVKWARKKAEGTTPLLADVGGSTSRIANTKKLEN